MPTQKLTKAFVTRIPFDLDERQLVYWDTRTRGLGLLVNKWSKSYIV